MRSGATDLQENGARLGGTGRPLVRSVWGKSGAVGETGPFSERTVVLSASEATIAGREPSKDRFGNYSDQQPDICLGRDALCTICWRDGMRSHRTGAVAARHCNVFEPAARPRRGRSAARSHRTRRWRKPELPVPLAIGALRAPKIAREL